MKSPVRQTSKESVDGPRVVYQCADCEVWSCCNYGPPSEYAGPERTEEDAVRGCKRVRCRCEMRGDVTDFDIRMQVRRARGKRVVGHVHAIDRVESKLRIVRGNSVGEWEPAANYRPEYA